MYNIRLHSNNLAALSFRPRFTGHCYYDLSATHNPCQHSNLRLHKLNGSLLEIKFFRSRLTQELHTKFSNGMTLAHRSLIIAPRFVSSHCLFSLSLIDLCTTQFLNLDIPFTNDVVSEDLSYEGFQATPSSTSENGVFGLENINPADLVTHPQGELETTMAPQPDAQSLELGGMFNDFDFGTEFATAMQEMESGAVGPLDTVVQPGTSYNDFTSLFQAPNNPELQSYTAAQQRQPGFFTRRMLEYINFDEVAEGELHNPPAL